MILLIDIDNTLSNAGWRDWMIDAEGWDAFHSNSHKDQEYPDLVKLANDLATMGWKVIAVTARPEKYRIMTIKWLLDHKVMIHTVLMRPDNDFRASPLVKLDLIKGHCKNFLDCVVMDDREDICLALQSAGLTALQVYRRMKDAG